MKVVATICSRKKRDDKDLLPVRERYLGDHVISARLEAEKAGLPLYILSGKFGLVSGDDLIPDYDYYLVQESGELVNMVKMQMEEAGITEIDFYYEDSEKWAPYTATLTKAAGLAGVSVHARSL